MNRYPHRETNIDHKCGEGVFFSQLIRIFRICDKERHFCESVEILTERFLNKGYNKNVLIRVLDKFLRKKWNSPGGRKGGDLRKWFKDMVKGYG